MFSDPDIDRVSFQMWLAGLESYGDNRLDRERAKRLLPIILRECVTEVQKNYILAYYVERLNTVQIAEKYGVNISTVSRTINRGLDRIYKYLRFSSPTFINLPRREGRLSNGARRRKSSGGS